jgi:hypothetical protein
MTDKFEERVWRTLVHHNLSRKAPENHLLTIVCIAPLPKTAAPYEDEDLLGVHQ